MTIDNDNLIRMYRIMLTIRRFDERASKDFKAGLVPGLVHSYNVMPDKQRIKDAIRQIL